MFAALSGICHLCREDKSIPIFRDGCGICAECNRQIEAEIDDSCMN